MGLVNQLLYDASMTYMNTQWVLVEWVDWIWELKEGFLISYNRQILTLCCQFCRIMLFLDQQLSDLWGAYQIINHLGFRNLTVNHSLHFVDPNTHNN